MVTPGPDERLLAERHAEAPGPLAAVESLVNAEALEAGRDELADPVVVSGWLVRQGLLETPPALTDDDLTHLRALRDGLRGLLAANNDIDPPRGLERDTINAMLVNLPLVVTVNDDGTPRLIPAAADPLSRAMATLLAAVVTAVASGEWARMKACRLPECRWAYYDRSRNRSRAWCSMETCGNRAKARAFRDRAR